MTDSKQIAKRYLSDSVRVASFWASVGVVIIHCRAIANATTLNQWVYFEQWFFHATLPSLCVPFFFIVSGFWFGRSRYVRGEVSFLAFVSKKLVTLGIPYVIFNFLGLVAHCFRWLCVAGGDWNAVSTNVFGTVGGWIFINRFLGVIGHPEFLWTMWYVRALLILFLFAPIWKWILIVFRHRVVFLLFASLCACVAAHILLPWSNPIDLGGQSAFFFVGMALSLFDDFKLVNVARKRRCIICLASMFVLWAIGDAIIDTCLRGADFCGYWSYVRLILQTVFQLAGVVSFWGIACIFQAKNLKWMSYVLNWSFLIYCFHGVFSILIVSGFHATIGYDGWRVPIVSLSSFIVIGAITFFCCWLLSKRFPYVARLLSGGRINAICKCGGSVK